MYGLITVRRMQMYYFLWYIACYFHTYVLLNISCTYIVGIKLIFLYDHHFQIPKSLQKKKKIIF